MKIYSFYLRILTQNLKKNRLKLERKYRYNPSENTLRLFDKWNGHKVNARVVEQNSDWFKGSLEMRKVMESLALAIENWT